VIKKWRLFHRGYDIERVYERPGGICSLDMEVESYVDPAKAQSSSIVSNSSACAVAFPPFDSRFENFDTRNTPALSPGSTIVSDLT
jgi:hypothetical protein